MIFPKQTKLWNIFLTRFDLLLTILKETLKKSLTHSTVNCHNKVINMCSSICDYHHVMSRVCVGEGLATQFCHVYNKQVII